MLTLPVCTAVLAFLLGLNLAFDLRITTPVVELLDSLNRIFYHLNSLVCELFGFAMIAVAAYFLMTLRQYDLGMFKQIIMILTIDSGLVVFAVYPLVLYFVGERDNPYKWLYAVIAPALVGFFSGDHYLSVTMLAKHGAWARRRTRCSGFSAGPEPRWSRRLASCWCSRAIPPWR